MKHLNEALSEWPDSDESRIPPTRKTHGSFEAKHRKEISHNTLQELDRRHLSSTRKMEILSILASLGMAFGFAGFLALIANLFFQ